MMLGSTASVNHFCRLPSLIERIGARLFGTLARAYVDDWVITDFVAAGDSAQQALATIHRCIGIPLAACQHACCSQCNRNPLPDPPPSVPKCKRRRPSQIQELLGVVCDVSQAHTGSSSNTRIPPAIPIQINGREDACDVPFPPRRTGKYWKGMIPLY